MCRLRSDWSLQSSITWFSYISVKTYTQPIQASSIKDNIIQLTNSSSTGNHTQPINQQQRQVISISCKVLPLQLIAITCFSVCLCVQICLQNANINFILHLDMQILQHHILYRLLFRSTAIRGCASHVRGRARISKGKGEREREKSCYEKK